MGAPCRAGGARFRPGGAEHRRCLAGFWSCPIPMRSLTQRLALGFFLRRALSHAGSAGMPEARSVTCLRGCRLGSSPSHWPQHPRVGLSVSGVLLKQDLGVEQGEPLLPGSLCLNSPTQSAPVKPGYQTSCTAMQSVVRKSCRNPAHVSSFRGCLLKAGLPQCCCLLRAAESTACLVRSDCT